MKKSKLMKALLVLGMSMVTATSLIGVTACGDDHSHIDENGDGKCDICTVEMTPEGGNTEGGNTEGGNTEGGNTEGGNTEGGNTEGGNTEGGNTEGGNTEGGNTEGGNGNGGEEEKLPSVTTWTEVDNAIYSEENIDGIDYIWHHLFLNDAVAKEYDFDGYEATVTVDGVASEVVIAQTMNGNDIESHTYHLHMRIKGNQYQTTVFTINFKKSGKTVATGTYTREATKDIVISSLTLNLTLDGEEPVTETLSVTRKGNVEGNIQWSVDKEDVATITENADGTVTVTAVAKGTAVISATVDGITKTCTVNVLEEGDEIPVITITDFEKFEGPYGDGRFYKFLFKATDANAGKYGDIKASFEHTKVDGAATDHKEFYEGGGVGCYIVTVHFSAEVVIGTKYKIDLCDASGNILATFTWTAPAPAPAE